MSTDYFFYVCKILMSVLYAIAAVVLAHDTLFASKKKEAQSFRSRLFALSIGAIGVFYVTYLVIRHLFPHFFEKAKYMDIIIVLCFAVLPILLSLLFMALYNRSSLQKKQNDLPVYAPKALELGEASHLFNDGEEDTVYGTLYEKLLSYFDSEKPYLQPGINVRDIAIHLFSNKTYLSRLLNDKLNQNFNQFVNSYRVKEAQRLVAEQGPVALSKLCKMVGFTSMATFTVAFKLNTGMTPGEWCKNYKRLTH